MSLLVRCKHCNKSMALGGGENRCGNCGQGMFTPGPLRKPVTPYAERKITMPKPPTAVTPPTVKLKRLSGTLLNASEKEAALIPPKYRCRWEDVELLSQIGEGGFATVFEAVHGGQRVAVKEMRYEEADAQQMRDFVQEVAMLTTIDHPHVVRLAGACLDDPHHLAILLEFFANGDAATLLDRSDVWIPWDMRLAWLYDVASAMSYLHSRDPQLLHRDLKTENLLICDNFQHAKVSDFGLSQARTAAYTTVFDVSETVTPRRISRSATTSPGPRRPHTTPMQSPALVRSSQSSECNSPMLERAAFAHLLEFGNQTIKVQKSGSSGHFEKRPRKLSSPAGGGASESLLPDDTHLHRRRRLSGSGQSVCNTFRTQRLKLRKWSMQFGTPSCLAPEVWRGEAYSERIDNYAFSMVMWEMMSRTWAFDGLDTDDICRLVRDERVRPLLPEWCPRSYRQLMTELWSEEPLLRPAFEECRQRLETLQKECRQWPPAANEWPQEEQAILEVNAEEYAQLLKGNVNVLETLMEQHTL